MRGYLKLNQRQYHSETQSRYCCSKYSNRCSQSSHSIVTAWTKLHRSTTATRAAWLIKWFRTWTPAANNIREVWATHVDVRPIDEVAITNISVTAPLRAIRLVWPDDHVAISCQTYHIIPVLCSVGNRLSTCSFGSCEVTWCTQTVFCINAEWGCDRTACIALVLL